MAAKNSTAKASVADVNGLHDVTLTPKQRAFLTAYALCGRVGHAAATAKVNRQSHHIWLKESAEYQRAWAHTHELIGTMAEDAAVERGVFGVKRLVLHQGRPVKVAGKYHYEIDHSDALLLAVLRKFKPERTANERHSSIAAASIWWNAWKTPGYGCSKCRRNRRKASKLYGFV